MRGDAEVIWTMQYLVPRPFPAKENQLLLLLWFAWVRLVGFVIDFCLSGSGLTVQPRLALILMSWPSESWGYGSPPLCPDRGSSLQNFVGFLGVCAGAPGDDRVS